MCCILVHNNSSSRCRARRKVSSSVKCIPLGQILTDFVTKSKIKLLPPRINYICIAYTFEPKASTTTHYNTARSIAILAIPELRGRDPNVCVQSYMDNHGVNNRSSCLALARSQEKTASSSQSKGGTRLGLKPFIIQEDTGASRPRHMYVKKLCDEKEKQKCHTVRLIQSSKKHADFDFQIPGTGKATLSRNQKQPRLEQTKVFLEFKESKRQQCRQKRHKKCVKTPTAYILS